jgi:hypothetical protein
MSDTVLLPRGWKGRRVEVESIAGKHTHSDWREGEIVQALDSGLVFRNSSGLRLYPWPSIICVKLLEELPE